MFYTIKLTPNHRDLPATLIGITGNPVEFITLWLAKRSQFSGTFVSERTRQGHNTYDNWSKLSLQHRVFVKMEGDKPAKDEQGNIVLDDSFDYRIHAMPIKDEITLNIPIERDTDAYHLL